KDGASHLMRESPTVYTPIKEWSPRLETKASFLPSGAHSTEPLLPRALKSILAGEEPSNGTVQICPALVNVTHLLSGEITGLPPSAKDFKGPPLNGKAQICTF